MVWSGGLRRLCGRGYMQRVIWLDDLQPARQEIGLWPSAVKRLEQLAILGPAVPDVLLLDASFLACR